MKISFLEALEEQFKMHNDVVYAKKMEQLMKHSNSYIGITTHLRLRILKYLYPDYKTEIKTNLIEIVNELFEKEEREYHYIALDLIKKNINLLYKVEYFYFIKSLIDKKPNWDTIDIYAKDILGKYLLKLPELTQTFVSLLSNSNNVWKIRSILLFQVHYKEKTNKNLLFLICNKFIKSNNYMINSAAIWALKEYKKYNSYAVNKFTHSNDFLLVYKPQVNRQYSLINDLIYQRNTEKAII